jgi:hypothetical protein
MAAAPVKTRRREKVLIVTSSLPAESLLAASVGSARVQGKRDLAQVFRVAEQGESEVRGSS